jgi:tetratricopeptide (TPR) repeat protein
MPASPPRIDLRAERALLAACVVVASLLGGGSQAWAEDVRSKQRKLNQDAQKAAAAKDYERAVELLRASLELGELNITQLNLGRVYGLAGRCWEAKEAYERVPQAPKVQDPPPPKVAQTLERYWSDLRQRCPGALTVECAPGARLRVDAQPARCGERLELPPGAHKIEAAWGEARAERDVAVVALEEQRLFLDAPLEAPSAPIEPLGLDEPRDPDPTDGAWLRGLGWSFGGLGLSALLGGVAVRFHAEGPLEEIRIISETPGGNLERYGQLKQVIERDELWFISALGVGAGCLTLSGVLLYWGYAEGEEAAPPAGALRWWFAPSGVGVEGRF